MKISFPGGFNNFYDISLSEYFEYILDENSNNSFNSDSPFPDIQKITTIPIIYQNIFTKSKLSSRFEVFHLFSPKLLEIRETISLPKKQKPKKLFLSRKKNRKEMKDNILKKIKSRFFKNIKKLLKDRLKKRYNYEGDFKFLSQKFICDITKTTNKFIWDQTFHEFMEEKLIDNNKNKDIILDAIEKDKIGIMTLKELFNEYLNSQEFVESIPNKNNEKELNQKYIDDYIFNANNIINYYSH